MGVLPVLSAILLASATHAEYTFVRRTSLAPRSQDVVLPPAEFAVPFTGKVSARKSKKAALAALRGGSRGLPSNTVVIDGSDFDDEYLTNVTVGGQHFALIIDTGSSDTWVPQTGFNCFDLDHSPVPESTCAFGTSGFKIAESKTFKPFPNVSFNITYGDGEFLSGPVGFDTISVGGLSVTNQEFAVPTLAAWEGDTINTGLMGLAFPDLTSVYNTTDPTKASGANQLPYDPFFFTAVKEKKLKNSIFSVSLDRGTIDQQLNDIFDANLGFLAFGGIAPVPVTKTAVTVPIEGYSATTGIPSSAPGSPFFFYTIDVESFTFPGSNKLRTAQNNTILDTGTTLNFVPTEVAAAYNAAFKPPAVIDPDVGGFIVPCNATVPEFLVHVGGKAFSIDGRDQLLPLGTDENGVLICITGTQDGGPAVADNIFILGDVFLHNVVSTFNPIAGQVTLTQRQKY